MVTVTVDDALPPGEALPRPQRPSLRRALAVYAGGNLVATGLQMLGGFFSTRLVEPGVLGLFSGYALVVEYLPLLGLGVFEGLDRQLPFCRGKNDTRRAEALAAAAQTWAACLGSFCAAVLSAMAIWSAVRGDWMGVAGWGANAVVAFLMFFSTNYLETLYRTHHSFSRLSQVLVVRAIVNVSLVPAVWAFEFYGLCLRALGILLAGSLTLWRFRPAKVPFRLDLGEVGHLIRIGAPIMAIGQVSTLWFVFNRTLILQMMGSKELGLYALYPMMLPALNLLPTAVAHIVYPRISEMYGRNPSLREITHYVWRPLGLLVLGMVPVIAAAWLVLPPAIEWLLPRYVEGVPAARWALLDLFVICLMQVRIVFFTIQKQSLYMTGIVAGVAANAAALLWLTRESVYLEAFPQAMLIGRVIYIAICYAILYSLCRREAASASRQQTPETPA